MTANERTRWRIVDDDDAIALYRLLTTTEPSWWRMVRVGLAPATVLAQASIYNAMVAIETDGQLVGVAALTDITVGGISGTLDLVAMPDSVDVVRSVTPAIITSIFRALPLAHLHHERFDGEPDLLGMMSPIWQHEVTFPEFALVEGRYADRLVYGVSRYEADQWLSDHPEVAAEVKSLAQVS